MAAEGRLISFNLQKQIDFTLLDYAASISSQRSETIESEKKFPFSIFIVVFYLFSSARIWFHHISFRLLGSPLLLILYLRFDCLSNEPGEYQSSSSPKTILLHDDQISKWNFYLAISYLVLIGVQMNNLVVLAFHADG